MGWRGLKSFMVWTDHKNSPNIQSAKCLNSCQAHLALFFSHFNFNLNYRPGSCNVKPDALSQQQTSEETPSSPDTTFIPS